ELTDGLWKVEGLGDVNADCRADIVVRNQVDGRTFQFQMEGNEVFRLEPMTTIPNDLHWVGVGMDDFDGDGHADLMMRNTVTRGPRAPSTVPACSANCPVGTVTSLREHVAAARTSASWNKRPSALCMRKCTARISSTLHSGIASPTRTAHAATSWPASCARVT